MPGIAADHSGEQRAGHAQKPGEVRLDHPEEVLVLELGELVAPERAAGVVDEDVGGLQLGGGGELVDRVRAAHVERQRERAGRAGLACRLGHFLQPVHATGAQHERMLELSERERGRLPEPRGCARDHHRPLRHDQISSTSSGRGSSRLPSALER